MSKIKTVPTPINVDWSAPGALTKPRRELQATDYQALDLSPRASRQPRHDGLAVGLLAMVITGGITFSTAAIILASKQAEWTATPYPSAIADDQPQDWGLPEFILAGLFGLGLWGLIRVRTADAGGHPDCPNHCPGNAPCVCGERVSVDVSIKVRD